MPDPISDPIPESQPEDSRPLRYEFGKSDLIFAAGMVLCCLFLANSLLVGGLALGFAMGSAASLVLTWWYLYKKGHKGDWYTRSLLVLSLVICAGFGYSSDGFVKFVLLLFLLTAGGLSFCLQTEQNRRAPGSVSSLLDAPRALFSLGLGRSGTALGSLLDLMRNSSEASRRGGAVLLGLVIALPVLGLLIPLLIFADAAFESLMDLLPSVETPSELIGTLIWGGLFFLCLFSRGVALHFHPKAAPSTSRPTRLSPITINTVLTMVSLLYLVFLFTQLGYFFSGFAGILPGGYSAASYARRGFFEMALLCGLNLGIMALSMDLASRSGPAPRLTKALCLFLGSATLFLVCASFAKMALYIGLYGLTRLRVLVIAIILFFGITTVVVSLWLYLPKLQYMRIVVLSALVIGCALLWADVDTQVARYNVTAYQSGRLAQIDVSHIDSLGDGALPWLVQLRSDPDPEVAKMARDCLVTWHWDHPSPFHDLYYVNNTLDLRAWTYQGQTALDQMILLKILP